MIPHLPSNPTTITPLKIITTPQDVVAKFAGRQVDALLFADVRVELQNLLDWDNYERATSPEREAAKRALHRILDQEP